MNECEKRIANHIVVYKNGCIDCKNKGEYCKTCMVTDIVNALEKQIPKKSNFTPEKYKDSEEIITINVPHCPNCGEMLIYYAGDKYCAICGQRIMWEGEE